MARRCPKVLRLLGVRQQRGDQGTALRRMHEEAGSSVDTEDPTDADGLQRAGGEPAEGDPVGLPTRRSRTRGRPIRALPGTGSGTSTTGTVFSARINSRGTTDRRTFVEERNNNKRKESTRVKEVCSNCQFFFG